MRCAEQEYPAGQAAPGPRRSRRLVVEVLLECCLLECWSERCFAVRSVVPPRCARLVFPPSQTQSPASRVDWQAVCIQAHSSCPRACHGNKPPAKLLSPGALSHANMPGYVQSLGRRERARHCLFEIRHESRPFGFDSCTDSTCKMMKRRMRS